MHLMLIVKFDIISYCYTSFRLISLSCNMLNYRWITKCGQFKKVVVFAHKQAGEIR